MLITALHYAANIFSLLPLFTLFSYNQCYSFFFIPSIVSIFICSFDVLVIAQTNRYGYQALETWFVRIEMCCNIHQ
jgi:uncharacterized membrane protein